MKWIFLLIPSLFLGQFNPLFFDGGKKHSVTNTSDIVAYYKLDNTYSDYAALSPSGVNSGSSFTTGKIVDCSLFTAATQQIDIPDSNNFSFTNGTNDLPFSISFWVYHTSFASSSNRILSKRDAAGTNFEWQFTSTPTLVQFVKGNTAATIFRLTNYNINLSLNTWYHFVVTSDGVNEKIYINGNNNSSATTTSGGTYTSMTNTTSGLHVANYAPGAASQHFGRIDEIIIWKNRKLEASEVNYMYNKGLSGLNIN